MTVKVRIPTALRQYSGNEPNVEVEAKTVAEAVQAVAGRYPELKRHLFDERGELRSFVNLFLNQEDVRSLSGFETALKPGDVLMIVPSVAGGAFPAGPPRPRPAPGGAGALSRDEVRQYSRHLIMPEVGLKGQEKLKAAKVLLVGTGGLGAPAALYLAAAGVGRIGLVDFDVVDDTNLQRQVLFSKQDVGRPKLKAAKERLEGLNPYIQVDLHERRFEASNAHDALRDYDVLVDGTDNFPTRYLANDVAVLQGKPNVYASIFRFEGQASVFDAKRGPCYRCLYAKPPPPGLVPSCAEGGVLGVLPGIMGSIQAAETVKILLGRGDSLAGRLLLFDALAMTFTELRLRKNPACPLCGPNATLRELIDYEEFCGVRGEEAPIPEGVPDVAVEEAAPLIRAGKVRVIDVREPHEWEIARIQGAKLIPLGELAARVAEIPQNEDVIVHCLSGARSARAIEFLQGLGYKRVRNLAGGIRAWADRVDPSVPKY